MPRLVFASLFPATWFLLNLRPVPLLWYLPLERRFVFASTVTVLGIDFFGKLLLASAVAGLGAFLAAKARFSPRAKLPWLVWPLVLFTLAFALVTTQLVQRVPVPLPRPEAGAR